MASCFYDRNRLGRASKCQSNDETEFKWEDISEKGASCSITQQPSHSKKSKQRRFSTYNLRLSFSPFSDACRQTQQHFHFLLQKKTRLPNPMWHPCFAPKQEKFSVKINNKVHARWEHSRKWTLHVKIFYEHRLDNSKGGFRGSRYEKKIHRAR